MAYYFSATSKASLFFFLILSLFLSVHLSSNDPVPTPWPHQFHSVEFVNTNGTLQIIELWYDWTNGRNFNIVRDQLGYVHYEILWNNGTTFYYTPGPNTCSVLQFDVGMPRPDWLDGATYLGQRHVDGFLCNAWEKLDFIWYYEDVVTKRPVHWLFFIGMEAHLMTFEVGAVLEDEKWQAPPYCFDGNQTTTIGVPNNRILKQSLPLMDGVLRGSLIPTI